MLKSQGYAECEILMSLMAVNASAARTRHQLPMASEWIMLSAQTKQQLGLMRAWPQINADLGFGLFRGGRALEASAHV